MAAMAAELVSVVGERCIIVLDAYFAVGPVFLILRQILDDSGNYLLHIVTRAKSNVVGYQDPPPTYFNSILEIIKYQWPYTSGFFKDSADDF
jgi:hypothetical protein